MKTSQQEVLNFGSGTDLSDSDKELLQNAKLAREKRNSRFSNEGNFGRFSNKGSNRNSSYGKKPSSGKFNDKNGKDDSKSRDSKGYGDGKSSSFDKKPPFKKGFKDSKDDDMGSFGVRISKKLADLGCCSRRDAEKLVTDGKVKINNIVTTDLAYKVQSDDTITLNGKDIPNKEPRLKIYLFHKPKGCVTTNRDPEGRRTVFDMIPDRFGRLISVGRLDYDTEGLLILTNSGDFARHMELPSNRVRRDYEVLVSGEVKMEELENLKDGIEIDGMFYKSIFVKRYKDGANGNVWLRVSIFEGKNREVRNIMSHFNLSVIRLIRVGYGKFRLSGIPVGCVVEYKTRDSGSSTNNSSYNKR